MCVLQFTTLENTPPEFLLLGNAARQSPTADTYCLGLCFLHLLAGREPYEVHLESVRCPDALLKKLQSVWQLDRLQKVNKGSPYAVVQEVVSTLASCDGEPFPIEQVFAHTLYRYLVLFAAAPNFKEGFLANELYVNNDVWRAVVGTLDLYKVVAELTSEGEIDNNVALGRRNRAEAAASKAFEEDVRKWSVHFGTSDVMQR